MKSSQVRDLARRYAAGQLSQENYRGQRRTLIDSIASGQQPLAYQEMRVKVPGRNTRMKLIAVAVVAVLLVAVAFKLGWKTLRGSRKTGAPAASAAFVPPPLPAPGPDLVNSFVETNDWTDPSLQDLENRWTALPSTDQGKARDSMMYPRLVTNLRQQITSEKAVANGGPDPHLAELTKLAKTLDIPVTPP